MNHTDAYTTHNWFSLGDSIQSIASHFNVSVDEVYEAIDYVQTREERISDALRVISKG